MKAGYSINVSVIFLITNKFVLDLVDRNTCCSSVKSVFISYACKNFFNIFNEVEKGLNLSVFSRQVILLLSFHPTVSFVFQHLIPSVWHFS